MNEVEELREKKLGIVSFMRRHIDVVVVTDACCVHQASHLPFVFVQLFVIIVHGSLFLEYLWFLIEMIAESCYTIATENTEDVSLLLSELWWCFSTKGCEFVIEESLYTSQA